MDEPPLGKAFFTSSSMDWSMRGSFPVISAENSRLYSLARAASGGPSTSGLYCRTASDGSDMFWERNACSAWSLIRCAFSGNEEGSLNPTANGTPTRPRHASKISRSCPFSSSWSLYRNT